MFGVQGVPMLFIITESGLITWQARFAACRQEDFDSFLREAIAELEKNEASLVVGKVNYTQNQASGAPFAKRGTKFIFKRSFYNFSTNPSFANLIR